MSLIERVTEYVRAGFSGIWIKSYEHEDALRDLAQLCQRESWSVNSGTSMAAFREHAAQTQKRTQAEIH